MNQYFHSDCCDYFYIYFIIAILVLSISAFTHLAYKVDQLWINFGTGKNSKFFAIHKMFEKIGADKAQAISFFYVLIECD